MFEQYTYKVKFLALLVIFAMLSITAYKRSFSTLIQLINENKELTNNIDQLNKKANDLPALEKEVAFLDKMIGQEGWVSQEVQQKLISFATNNHKASIYNLQPIHFFNDEKYSISTNQIDVTGGVNPLLNLSYSFEKDFNVSKPVSLNFYTTKKSNQTEALHLKITFQNYANIR